MGIALAILTGDIKIQLSSKNIFSVITDIIWTLSISVCAIELQLLIFAGGESLHKKPFHFPSKYSEYKITDNEAHDRAN